MSQPKDNTMKLAFTLSQQTSQFEKRMERSLSIHGISFTEFQVLHQLCHAPEEKLSRIELAEHINLTASGVTRLLNPVEKNPLVIKEKNQRDARISWVVVTETGKEIYDNALTTFRFGANKLTENLTTKQIDQLLQLLKGLA